jgi:hypothetical protein
VVAANSAVEGAVAAVEAEVALAVPVVGHKEAQLADVGSRCRLHLPTGRERGGGLRGAETGKGCEQRG